MHTLVFGLALLAFGPAAALALPLELPALPREGPREGPREAPREGAREGAREAACPPPPAACTWARTFGAADVDKLYALAPTADGGALVAGSTRGPGRAREDGWTLKLDRAGGTLWERRDGGGDTEQLYGIVAAGDGGAFVAGHTRSAGAGESDLWLARLDEDGRRLWDTTLGGPANDRARALAATADGGLVAAGFSVSASAGGRDVWVVALDRDGGVRWERRFGGRANEMAYAVAAAGLEVEAGGVVVAGYRPRGRDFDAWLLRLDGDGELLWQATLDRTPFDLATAVAFAGDDVVMAATSRDDGLDVRLARFDAAGALLWDRVLGGPGAETIWALATTRTGYVLAGSTASRGEGSQDVWLVGVDREDGTVRWQETHGGPLWERATSLAALADGTLWVAGYTTSRGAGFEDGWVLRLDARGRR